MAQQSLIKLLAAAGIGSRRQLASAIKKGSVKVNDKIAESFNQPVDSQKDNVTLDGKPVVLNSEKLLYLMLNKPKGIVSTTESDRGETTILDLLPAKYRMTRLYPVGRLDKDSLGLVLITNDGELTFHLTHPRFQHEKEYFVQIPGTLTIDQKNNIERGVELSDGRTSPARIRPLKLQPFNYALVIHEGKKRQVRRMFASLGFQVIELKRVRIGGLQLGDLAEGTTRELTKEEVRLLKNRRQFK
jgi:23S rRNA pseudouridine2605 synthase